MNLDLINNILDNLKENNIVQKFTKELSNSIENKRTQNLPIIQEFLSKNNLTIGSENAIIFGENDAILKCVENLGINEPIYFVKDSKKTYWQHNEECYDNNFFTVLKIENNKIEKIQIDKKDIPENINVNDVFKIENNQYILDNELTKEIQNKIRNMAENIIEKQNNNLSKYRKQDHIYLVTEEVGNKRILVDLTENNNIEFEEYNFSKEVLEKAIQGAKLKFNNGKYEYCSNSGFEN